MKRFKTPSPRQTSAESKDPTSLRSRQIIAQRTLTWGAPVVLTMLLFGIAFVVIALIPLRHNLLHSKEDNLKRLTETTNAILMLYYQKEVSGEMTQAQAQDLAKEAIRLIRYEEDQSGYYFIVDTNEISVMHPLRKELEGSDMSQIVDPNGKRYIHELVTLAKAHGEGSIEYLWYLNNDPNQRIAKISYARLFKPWNWIVGTGIYAHDIMAEVDKIAINLVIFSALTLALVGALAIVLIRRGLRAEKQRLLSEERLNFALEAVNDAIWDWKPEQGTLYWSPRYLDMLGYQPEEIAASPENWQELLHPEDAPLAQQALADCIDGKEDHYEIEARFRSKEGAWCWILIRGRVLERNPAGKIIHMAGTHSQIDERKRMESALYESERSYREIYNSTKDPILIHDAKTGAIIDVNQAMLKTYGYTYEEALQLTIEDISGAIEGYTQEQAKFRVDEAVRAGAATFEWMAKRKDGSTFWVEVQLDRSQIGGADRILAVVRDIDERKRMEATMRQSEARTRAVIDNAPFGAHIYELMPDNRLVFTGANLSANRILAVDHAQFIGKTIEEAFPPLAETDIPDAYRRVAASGQPLFRESVDYSEEQGIQGAFEIQASQIGPRQMAVFFTDITERKRGEAALRESEKRYRQLFEAESDAILLIDNQSEKILEANSAAAAMYGYSREELLGKPNVELSAEPEQTQHMTETTPTLEDRVVTIPLRYHRKQDGSTFPVEITGRFFVHQGRSVHIAAIRDITQRQRMEEALRESTELIKVQFENSPDTITIVDQSGKILATNQPYANLEAISTLDHQTDRLLPPEYWQLAQQTLERCFDTGEAQQFEHSTHVGRWMHTRAVALKTGDQVTRVLLISTDITERKQAQEALRESEERYRTLAETASDLIFIIGLDDQVKYVNSIAAQTISQTPAQVIGRPRSDIFPPAVAKDQKERIDKVLATGQESYFEAPIPIPGGEMWLGTSLAPLKNSAGEYIGVMGVARDITQRKQAEEAIHKLNEELEERVRRRTIQLENANQELESFAYSVSHDLRTPLRSIDGFSKIILEDYQERLDENGRHYLERIRASAQRMAQLIDDLLLLARVTRADIRRSPVDLNEMAHLIAAQLDEEQPDRKVEWAINPNMTVQADPGLIRIVLENLITNAWKFTAQRIPARIELGTLTQGGETVYYIRDNGIGFDMSFASKLFGVFQRLHDDHDFPGTGIGLATVQRVIQRHGGKIWAEAAVDQGAAFYFTIPPK